MRHKSWSHIHWLLPFFIITYLLTSSAASPGLAQDNAPSLTPPEADRSVFDAPAMGRALVTDLTTPGWFTAYGNEVSLQAFSARQPAFETAPDGPQVPLGAWYTSLADPGGAYVTAIQGVPDGRLFVGLYQAGLRAYTPDTAGSYAWRSYTSANSGLASDIVNDLAYLDGELWVATGASGLSVLNLQSGIWRQVNTGNSALPDNGVKKITAVQPPNSDPSYLWFSSNSGAFRHTPSTNAWQIFNTGNSGLVSNIVNDVAVLYTFGTTVTWFATENGVSTYTAFSNTWVTIKNPVGCSFDIARRVVVDKDLAFWIIPYLIVPAMPGEAPQAEVPNGVCRYSGGVWQNFDYNNTGLPSTAVTDLSVDQAGRVWMSFNSYAADPKGGAAVYDQGTWLIFETPSAPLYNDRLSRVHADGEAVWFGHYNASALSIYSPNWNRYNEAAMGGLGNPLPILIEAATTWIGQGAGLAYRDASAWHPLSITGNSSRVTTLARDGGGLLWAGTQNNGLFSYDGIAFTHHTTSEGLPSDDIRDLLVDHNGELWIATGGGLALQTNGYWVPFTSANSGLASDDLTALALDAYDRIWAGSASSGLSIYSPQAAAAWSYQTTSDGLPSDEIHDLTTDPFGAVWAATSGGAGAFSPGQGGIGGVWQVFDQANNALPSDEALSVASDALGRVWVGTANGLAQRKGFSWQHFHVPSSMLGRDRVVTLAADQERLWAASGNWISVRGVPAGPVGFNPPQILSFSPTEGVPGTQVTITGNNFDDKNPSANKVLFGTYNGFFGTPAQVLSATNTQLVVLVPLLAESGRIQVEAHGLKVESANDYKVLPRIDALQPACLGLGDELKIQGIGFNGGGAAQVKIGNGNWRLAGSTNPTLIRTHILPGDTNGVVRVKVTNGKGVSYTMEAASSSNLSIAQPSVGGYSLQQAVQDLKMVWGKKTLVRLSLWQNQAACNAHISGGKVEWHKVNGTYEQSGQIYLPGAGPLNVQPYKTTDLNAVVGYPVLDEAYPLSQVTGVRVTAKNGPVTLFSYEIPIAEFKFVDVPLRKFLNLPVIPPNYGDANYKKWYQDARLAIYDVGRVYPLQDYNMFYGAIHWQTLGTVNLTRSVVDLDEECGFLKGCDFGDLKDWVDDWREFINDQNNAGLDQGVALIAPELYKGGPTGKATTSCSNPISDCNKTSVAVFLFPGDPSEGLFPDTAGTYLQEITHSLTWVQTWAANHDSGNKHHSRYDEGEWGDLSNCKLNLSYREAIKDQMGFLTRVYRLPTIGDQFKYSKYSSNTTGFYQFPMNGCGKPETMPRSAMAYTPVSTDPSTFFEPLDYSYVLCKLLGLGALPGYCGSFVIKQNTSLPLSPLNDPSLAQVNIDPLASLQPQAPSYSQTLRLTGTVYPTGEVDVRMSYLLGTEGQGTAPEPDGDYHVLIYNLNGDLLQDFPFSMATEETHIHGAWAGPQAAGDPLGFYSFSLRLPFPDGATSVQLQHDGQELWSDQVSPNPPSVSFISPLGGSYSATDDILVSWSASDRDGDPLKFGLEYSHDDGASWQVVMPLVMTDTQTTWTPGFVPGGRSARLRLTASDGFNTTQAVSPAFDLSPRAPFAFIFTPQSGDVFLEGQSIDLVGGSQSASGMDQGLFTWQLDGEIVGQGRQISLTLDTPGDQVILLEVMESGQTDYDESFITVLPDSDRDGLDNDYELSQRLNPLYPGDADEDADHDGLSARRERQLGTSPRMNDTDGDGASDGYEVEMGTDPLRRDDVPIFQIFLPLTIR